MATTADYKLGEFTFPRGWFMVATSAELETHKPLAVRFFGKDFALYRGRATGKLVLLDAYCPHMGTHLAAPNKTSYVIQDGAGSNVEGDGIRCPYHAWRFGPDGKCDDIPYHSGPIPAAACVKSWTVKENLGAIWVWHDAEGGAPEWELPTLTEWDDPNWINGAWDHLGMIQQHPQELVDNIVDYGHLAPIHGSTVERFENEFAGHTATQRLAGGHRTLVGPDGVSAILYNLTTYHGPGMLISAMTGLFETQLLITHTPVDDGSVKVWHNLVVRPMSGGAPTAPDRVAAKQFQESSLLAFAQDVEVWTHKAPCFTGLFLPSDGPFMKARIWYQQFYNPRAKAHEFHARANGLYVPRGATPFTAPQEAA